MHQFGQHYGNILYVKFDEVIYSLLLERSLKTALAGVCIVIDDYS